MHFILYAPVFLNVIRKNELKKKIKKEKKRNNETFVYYIFHKEFLLHYQLNNKTTKLGAHWRRESPMKLSAVYLEKYPRN